ncbi:MAG: nucleotidyltransferase family protein [Clostridia bacterium]|nr:nucleotidyltransferase family protein [Clostridia bacterium]
MQQMLGDRLVAVINSLINKTELPDVTDWDRLSFVANSHSLGSIFHLAVKDSDKVPENVKKEAEKQYLSEVRQQTLQEYYAQQVFDKFDENGIEYMPMKGWILRHKYPSLDMRTSCDVDFLYKVNQADEIEKIFHSLGFKRKIEHETVGGWIKDVVLIEDHNALFEYKYSFYSYFEVVWDKLITSNGTRYDFTNEDYYLYMVAHNAKHFLMGGIGIRSVLDVYFYLKNTELNREKVNNELAKMGLVTFANTIEELANVWFGNGEYTEQTNMVAKFIFNSGTYGLAESNAFLKASNRSENSKGAKSRYLIKTLFPAYRTMCVMYPVLRKAPFLLPIFWVVKWFTVLIKRPKRFKSTIKFANKMNDERLSFTDKVVKILDLPKN